ncbi:TPA: Tn7-like element transposition protein TnsE, partial [Escherichia coli]|nr:hypothetical protein [Escherichia coli]HDS0157508.1 hypothetical protein [Escherichia coli]
THPRQYGPRCTLTFDQLYGQDGHRGVNHPKGLGELQVSREDMEGWAERVVREQFTH